MSTDPLWSHANSRKEASMARSLTILFTALALSWLAMPASAGQLKSCNADCRAMRSAMVKSPKATSIPLVCIHFRKLRPGATVLKVFGKNGEVIRRLAKKTGASGKYCLGHHWVVQAAQVHLCDENGTGLLLQNHLQVVLELSRTPKGDPIRLWRE